MQPTFPLLENYCSYMLAALGRSERTVLEYRYDLILFARFLKIDRGLVPADTPLEEIDISDTDVKVLNKVTRLRYLAFALTKTIQCGKSQAHRITAKFFQVSSFKKKSYRQ